MVKNSRSGTSKSTSTSTAHNQTAAITPIIPSHNKFHQQVINTNATNSLSSLEPLGVGINSNLSPKSGKKRKSGSKVRGVFSSMFGKNKSTSSSSSSNSGLNSHSQEVNIKISTPFNAKHLAHVGIDDNGSYTGLPIEWERLLSASGITKKEQQQHPQAVMDIVAFYQDTSENPDDAAFKSFILIIIKAVRVVGLMKILHQQHRVGVTVAVAVVAVALLQVPIVHLLHRSLKKQR